MEGIIRPQAMGCGYANAIPRHIGDLRSEALRRREEIDVNEKVYFTRGFSKSVYMIKQRLKQIE